MNHNGRKLFHSSIRISGSKKVYIDPWQVKNPAHDADVIFVTHDHHDHYSPDDISNIAKEDTIVVAPSSMCGIVDAVYVEPGQSYCVGGVSFETVAAYNIGRPFHSKEKNYVGYIVLIDGVRYYIAGDTDMIPENTNIKCDVAFVPIGGTFTMDAAQGAALINSISPAVAIPTHYGTVTDSADAADNFMALVCKDICVEIHEDQK